MSARIRVVTLLLGASLLAAGRASAWEVDAPLHSNCHERLTVAALDAVGYRGGAAASPTVEESLFIRSQQFDTWGYPDNMDALALIIGVRFNDLRGLSDADLDALAAACNEDQDQPAHCLRRLSDDGPAGDEAAIGRCREYIEQEVALALEGLDAAGTAAPEEDVPVYIPFVGTITWPLSRFYFHAGRALHALQDAFTHTYRDPTWHGVYAVFNWLDPIRGDLDEYRDGHPHERLLDECDTPRPWRAAQLTATAEASERLYRLLVTANSSAPDATRAALADLLDDWLAYVPGCDLANGYCGSEVHADLAQNGPSAGTSAGGCAAAGRGSATAAALVPLALVVAATRRRAPAILTAVLIATPAWAAGAGQPGPAPAVIAVAPVPAPAEAMEPALTVRGLIRMGMSVSEPAWTAGGGVVLAWGGLDLETGIEWNPWVSVERRETFAGSLNAYAVVAWRWQVSPAVDLETGFGGGVAILLFETVGTPAGNVGPFLTLRPLGVARRVGERLALTVNAFEVAVPIPQTRGVPFSHPQYRLAVGLRF